MGQHLENLRAIVNDAPGGPGCYLWKDSKANILYVGKAINLRSRLRSYVGSGPQHIRTALMVARATQVEWISTLNGNEALILEANLVKKYKPRFNVRLKDDKRYPFICVSTGEMFPRVYLTRTIRDDGHRYFGPYTDVGAARATIALIHKIFPVRKVKQSLPLKTRRRPCINFHIKRCLAPCQGNITEEQYSKIVEEILLFMEGRREILENLISERMQAASVSEAFERASIYRDMLLQIRRMSEDQNVSYQNVGDEDVLALARREDHGQMVLVEVRSGQMIGRKSFPLQGVLNVDDAEVIASFARDHYLNQDQIPGRIVLPEKILVADKKILEEVFWERVGHKVRLVVASKGHRVSILKLARRNAEMLLSERLLAARVRDREAMLADIQKMLNLNQLPEIMECYDISHMGGTEIVASGIVFLDGAPHRSAYRRYRIRSVDGIDDPASMREVIARRLQRLLNENQSLPDLILIDGGLTQLTAACEAAIALDQKDLAIVSLAKKLEEIYVPGRRDPYNFDSNRPGMRLLRQLRDEAHRFAVGYQRNRRNKSALRTLLDAVPEIGDARRKTLLKHFTDHRVEEATQSELQQVDGIGPKLAYKIWKHLKKEGPQ